MAPEQEVRGILIPAGRPKDSTSLVSIRPGLLRPLKLPEFPGGDLVLKEKKKKIDLKHSDIIHTLYCRIVVLSNKKSFLPHCSLTCTGDRQAGGENEITAAGMERVRGEPDSSRYRRRSRTTATPFSLIKKPSDEARRLAENLAWWGRGRSRELWEVAAELRVVYYLSTCRSPASRALSPLFAASR